MVITFENLVKARFIRRINRFIAEVELDSQLIQVHVPSTGRLDTVLKEGSPCYLKPSPNPARKTPYSIFIVETPESAVCIDALVANRFTDLLLQEGVVPDIGSGEIRKEVKAGGSRFDFAVQDEERTHLIEVKSVNMVMDGTACFPDAPTDRGTRHVQELMEWQKKGDIQTHVIFVVQRSDAKKFAPCSLRDPAFAKAVQLAWKAGTKVHACLTEVTPEQISFEKWIPVEFEMKNVS
ncbi:MAG: DNA/RNA nuclease SfsA [Bacillaceae bacterium]|nr:DNA/RNA nuclease SfsA [Bacillaceae bacterium]